jgi:hypothetical protein
MSISTRNRPLSDEEKCSEYSDSSDQYFACLRRNNIQLFQTPKQQLPTWAIVLIVIGVYIYIVKK